VLGHLGERSDPHVRADAGHLDQGLNAPVEVACLCLLVRPGQRLVQIAVVGYLMAVGGDAAAGAADSTAASASRSNAKQAAAR
jgi:hypothetical protein